MQTVRKPYLKVLYDGKNITAYVTPHLLSLSYVDKVEGESDEIELELEDVDALWRGAWYPEKGAMLDITIGYDDFTLNCGTFQLDEIELVGPPDTVRIRGLAAAITGKLRTKNSYAHENKTLLQIARTVAARNGLTVEGSIPDVRFDRITQSRETDLAFLRRIGAEYGCLFSVRDKKLVFTTIFDIEATKAATTIDRLDIRSYSIKDTSAKTYQNTKVVYHNPIQKKVIEQEYKFENNNNPDNYTYSQIVAGDTKVIHTKAENKQQAELKAKAALHKANSKQQEGSLTMEGNPLIVAGNNFELTGFGSVSGKYHVTESRHTISRTEGYSTEATIKRVGFVEATKQVSTKRTKERLAAAKQPKNVAVAPASVDTIANKDNYTFTQINQ